jgi:superfamily II DNA or RNA helicase
MHPNRYYQDDILNQQRLMLPEKKALLVQAPTGSGKSHIINCTAIENIALGKTVLVLSETADIYDQLVIECSGIEINSEVKHRYIEPGKCYVAMAQTLVKRPKIIEQLIALGEDLIVLNDEAHIGTTTKLIKILKESALLIGYSATPSYNWAKFLPDLYNDIIVGPQVDELIRNGHLCNYRHIARTKGGLNELLLRGADYSEESQERVFGATGMYKGVFEDLRSIPFKKCIIFTASIKACGEMLEKLLEEGFAACQYHSEVPNKKYQMARFTTLHECNIIVSVASLTKGWDFKPIDLVVLYRKTTSLPLYLQMLGRASRVIAGIKEFFITLDYGENYKDHQTYFYDRDWQTDWNTPKKKKRSSGKEDASGFKVCINCDSIIPTSARRCSYCDFELPLTPQQLQEGELIDITEKYHELKGRSISTLNPEELANYAKLKNKKPYAIRIAKAQEQMFEGFLPRFAAAMGYKKTWLDLQLDAVKSSDEIIEFMDQILI